MRVYALRSVHNMDRRASSIALFDAVCANDVNMASLVLKMGADVNVLSRKRVRID